MEEGGERRLHSSMCDSLYRLCLWETGIVWHLLCNDHDLFLFCFTNFTNEYHYCASVWAGVTCESCCRTLLLRRKETGGNGPGTKLKLRTYNLTRSFRHISCRSWAQSFVSYPVSVSVSCLLCISHRCVAIWDHLRPASQGWNIITLTWFAQLISPETSLTEEGSRGDCTDVFMDCASLETHK